MTQNSCYLWPAIFRKEHGVENNYEMKNLNESLTENGPLCSFFEMRLR